MDHFSQSSTLSNVSTIPPEIIDYDDDDFLDEIERLNDLYYGNIEVHENVDTADVNNNTESDSDGDDEGDGTDFYDNVRDIDVQEDVKLANFKDKTCGCVRLYGKPCSSTVNWEALCDYRNRCLELDKNELDMMIKVQLFHHRNNDTMTDAKKHKPKDREKPRQSYYFHGNQVCRETFAFCHGIGRKQIDAIAHSLDTDGLVPRTHGNTGKSPKHAMTMQDVQNVKLYIMSHANKFGLPLPGRLPNYRNEKAILLPSDKSKADIHQEYQAAAEQLQYRKVCLSQFKTIWLEQCPHVLLMKPSTDLCHKCQSFTNSLSNAGNLTEEQKTDILSEYQEHVNKVKVQRDNYRQQCDAAKTVYNAMETEERVRGMPPCSKMMEFHYSFDYAKQVHYPHYAQQVGPLFFKTPRKCQCFGVCAEGSGSQIFYLVDESQHQNKGANTVTSMLHHHFQYHGYGETDVKLHMDNCSGQNKNNTVIGYGMWRVLMGMHDSVEFSLMEAGHTKFNPDWHFGLWKVKWRNSTVETLDEIATSVTNSSRNHHNVPQLVDDDQKPVKFFDWSSYLKQFFKPIPHLKTYHHFRMDKDHRGVVFMKTHADAEESSINIMKREPGNFPEEITQPGLEPQRQWYLYEEVAPYCKNSVSCPKPSVPKPVIKLEKKDAGSKRKISH